MSAQPPEAVDRPGFGVSAASDNPAAARVRSPTGHDRRLAAIGRRHCSRRACRRRGLKPQHGSPAGLVSTPSRIHKQDFSGTPWNPHQGELCVTRTCSVASRSGTVAPDKMTLQGSRHECPVITRRLARRNTRCCLGQASCAAAAADAPGRQCRGEGRPPCLSAESLLERRGRAAQPETWNR